MSSSAPAAAPAPATPASLHPPATAAYRLDGTSGAAAVSGSVGSSAARGWVRNGSGMACQATTQAKQRWNEQVAKPTNEAARKVAKQWSCVRKQYPAEIVGGATVLAALASAPFGRRALVRNTVFGFLFSALAVAPSATIGTMALIRDRAALSAGLSTPSTVIVQQPVAVAATPADK